MSQNESSDFIVGKLTDDDWNRVCMIAFHALMVAQYWPALVKQTMKEQDNHGIKSPPEVIDAFCARKALNILKTSVQMVIEDEKPLDFLCRIFPNTRGFIRDNYETP